MLIKELIQLNQHCTNMEEAIRVSLQPFLDNKFITESYVEDVISQYKNNGPQLAIAPQIALPHATTCCGVLKTGFGITTLDQPIYIQSSDVPIKYIVPVCSNCNDSQLRKILILSKVLTDRNLFNLLETSTSIDELFDRYTNSNY